MAPGILAAAASASRPGSASSAPSSSSRPISRARRAPCRSPSIRRSRHPAARRPGAACGHLDRCWRWRGSPRANGSPSACAPGSASHEPAAGGRPGPLRIRGGSRLDVRIDIRLERGDFRSMAASRCGDRRGCHPGALGLRKSTLIEAIAGIVVPRQGVIAIGRDVFFDSAAGVNVRSRRRGCGLVFQDARLFPHLSVAQNLAYAWRGGAGAPSRKKPGMSSRCSGIGHCWSGVRPRSRAASAAHRHRQGAALAAAPPAAGRAALGGRPRSQERDSAYLERLRTKRALPISMSATPSTSAAARRPGSADRGRSLRCAGPTASVLSPAAWPASANSIFDGRVLRHDPGIGLTESNRRRPLPVPLTAVPVGGALRLVIDARDVALADRGAGRPLDRNASSPASGASSASIARRRGRARAAGGCVNAVLNA